MNELIKKVENLFFKEMSERGIVWDEPLVDEIEKISSESAKNEDEEFRIYETLCDHMIELIERGPYIERMDQKKEHYWIAK